MCKYHIMDFGCGQMVVERFSCAAKQNVYPYHQHYQPRGSRVVRTITIVRYDVDWVQANQLRSQAAPASAPRGPVINIRIPEWSSDGEGDAGVQTQGPSSRKKIFPDVGIQGRYSHKEMMQYQPYNGSSNIHSISNPVSSMADSMLWDELGLERWNRPRAPSIPTTTAMRREGELFVDHPRTDNQCGLQ